MARPKTKRSHLLPTYALRLRQWGMTRRNAWGILKLQRHIDIQAFWRILRCDFSTDWECWLVANAIYTYGIEHKLHGAQELQADVNYWSERITERIPNRGVSETGNRSAGRVNRPDVFSRAGDNY